MVKLTLFLILIVLSSCTISLSNVSTNGKATDVVDELQSATPAVDVKATIPLI